MAQPRQLEAQSDRISIRKEKIGSVDVHVEASWVN